MPYGFEASKFVIDEEASTHAQSWRSVTAYEFLYFTPALFFFLLESFSDFGFAQYLASDEQKLTIRGSPLYMAPEILLRHKYDARVDLWSVGVIMYECLFGKAPYSSETFQELADKIKDGRLIEVRTRSNFSAILSA